MIERICENCAGSGFVEIDWLAAHTEDFLRQTATEDCQECNGKGYIHSDCWGCGGKADHMNDDGPYCRACAEEAANV